MTDPIVQSPPSSVIAPPRALAGNAPSDRLPRASVVFLILCAILGVFVGLAGVLVGYGLSTMVL